MIFEYFYEEEIMRELFCGNVICGLTSDCSKERPGKEEGHRDMSEIDIRIDLDPMNDGIVSGKAFNPDRLDKRALIIGTNGKYRLISIREAEKILHSMRECSGSLFLDDGGYLVIYNADKTFESDGSDFYAGSMLVLRAEGEKMFPLSEDEIKTVLHLLDGRMAEFSASGQMFQALEVG